MQLTDRERAIIALLGTGDTDAAVAVTLGLSVRTIAYTVKELMERHGVRSRFQLGLVLGGENGHEKRETQAGSTGQLASGFADAVPWAG